MQGIDQLAQIQNQRAACLLGSEGGDQSGRAAGVGMDNAAADRGDGPGHGLGGGGQVAIDTVAVDVEPGQMPARDAGRFGPQRAAGIWRQHDGFPAETCRQSCPLEDAP